ncbi:MAG: phosphoribosylaminoimidazolecarboxamide formyltransferase / cyclohydrolase [Candidatus Sumerlaeota bacterium]|nr:phosphoribosylaminoimidazolecarboxamide formyltransferase / cyclohydrolase [Candidatus Sumerlaeota bacterium]
MPIQRALLSVSDKTGLADFAKTLAARGVELISTGGTAKALRDAGLAVRDISEVTGFPEILDGRVKTLHPMVHGGLLGRGDKEEHVRTMAEHGIARIDLVVVNLYPFVQTIAKPGVKRDEAVEQIDIGGPSMLRSAAKNFGRVTAVCDPADYESVAAEIVAAGDTTAETRAKLAAKVFAHTAAYDAAIGAYLAKETSEDKDALPPVWTMTLPRQQELRYGENPHQRAAFYRDPAFSETSLATAKQLQGKHLSYNNILDAEGALEMVRDFAGLAPAAAVIVKHSNPCGIALGATALEAYDRARATDPDSAFGGIIALSVEVDGALAERIGETFNEVVLAPSYAPEALERLAKKKNLRLLATGAFTPKQRVPIVRGVVGGLLVTDRDLGEVQLGDLKVVTTKHPTDEELKGMLFAWRCVKWVKSNAIVYARDSATVGIGAGQMSRVDAARVGAEKARTPLAGCTMASDAFFPFRDNIDTAAKAGIASVIQPGGSVRDAEVIEAANEHGIAMVFTGMRHFRH